MKIKNIIVIYLMCCIFVCLFTYKKPSKPINVKPYKYNSLIDYISASAKLSKTDA